MLRIGLDQVDQVHRAGALNPAMTGVDLERQLVSGAQLDEPPHDEVFEVLDFGGGQFASRMPERLAARSLGTFSNRSVRR